MKAIHLVFPIFVALFVSHIGLCEQNQNKTDSLSFLLRTTTSDSIKIDLYLSLSQHFAGSDPSKILRYLDSATVLSEVINDKKRLTRSFLELAKFYDSKGNLPMANHALEQAGDQLRHFSDIKYESRFFMQRGIIRYFEGSYSKAVEDILKALAGYKKIGDSTTVGSCNILMGVCYEKLENWAKALYYYSNGLSIYESTGYEKGVAMAIGNMGKVYKAKKDFSKAMEYYFKSLQFNEQKGFQKEARIDLNNIGVLYSELKNYPKALEYHHRALQIAEAEGSQTGVLFSKYNLSEVQHQLGNHKKSLEMSLEALALAKELNSKEDIMNSYLLISNIYEAQGNAFNALKNRKEYEMWKDSIISESHLNKVKKLELEYETVEKDQQITLLAKENEVQEKETQRQATLKNAFIIGLILTALLGGLFTYTMRQRFKNQKVLSVKNNEIKEANFKRQLTELEMKALQAQINPHFIFNCMNSINQMILGEENDNASKYLTKFSKLIRMILENAESTEVSLKDELNLLESYIQLEELRFDGNISYDIKVDESINAESTYLPTMVLQPFVENAIWHGIAHKKEAGNGKITIAVKDKKDKLLCVIEDNGVGREKALELEEKSVWKSSKSLGLKITEERLKLLSNEVQKQLIKIIDLKDAVGRALGTRVEVVIGV